MTALTIRADVLEAMKRIVVDEIEDDGSGKLSQRALLCRSLG